jgi:arylsulfatase A-like enzyme
MDRAVGRVLAELDTLGLRDNTLVIFASDNGAARQAPLATLRCVGSLRGMKAQLYEGGLRVPFIVNMPGSVAPQTIDSRIWFPDVLPTLARIACAEEYLPVETDGVDISPLFYGDTKPMDTDSRLMYWEFPGKQRAAICGEWKAVSVKRGAPLELYQIANDPNETCNLATLYPEKVARMDSLMQCAHTPSPNFPE